MITCIVKIRTVGLFVFRARWMIGLLAVALWILGMMWFPEIAEGVEPDRDCSDFSHWEDAQAFFLKEGGPDDDPHNLDGDDNGIACESLRSRGSVTPGAPVPSDKSSGIPWWSIVIAVGAVVVLAIGGKWWLGRRSGDDDHGRQASPPTEMRPPRPGPSPIPGHYGRQASPPIEIGRRDHLGGLIRGLGCRIEERWEARISYVVDGDSVEIEVVGDPLPRRCRLFGIDAPDSGMWLHEESRRELQRLLCDRTIWTVSKVGTDWYDRAVVLIYHNTPEESVNRDMVRNGYAYWYHLYARDASLLRHEENEARQEGLGVWSEGHDGGIRPWDYRRDKRN